MLIDDTLLDALAREAQASPRLRMNRDLRNSPASRRVRKFPCTATATLPKRNCCCAGR